MLLLSKYIVLEYLHWRSLNQLLLIGELSHLIVSDLKFDNSDSRNITYELNDRVNNKTWVVKQYGPNIKEKESFYRCEKEFCRLFCKTNNYEYDDNYNILVFPKYDNSKGFVKFIRNLNQKDGTEFNNSLSVLTEFVTSIKKLHDTNIEDNSIFETQKFKPNSDFFEKIANSCDLFVAYNEFKKLFKADRLVHHDINSNNIIFVDDRELKLIDFEMLQKGDPYVDLSSLLTIICFYISDNYFFETPIIERNSVKILKIAEQIIKTYGDVDIKKLKVFFIIQNLIYQKDELYLVNIHYLFDKINI